MTDEKQSPIVRFAQASARGAVINLDDADHAAAGLVSATWLVLLGAYDRETAARLFREAVEQLTTTP